MLLLAMVGEDVVGFIRKARGAVNGPRQIVLTPVRIQRGDAVRVQLAELDLDEKDIADAVASARKMPATKNRASNVAFKTHTPRSHRHQPSVVRAGIRAWPAVVAASNTVTCPP